MSSARAPNDKQECPLLEHRRKDVWPVLTSVQRELHDKLEDLKKTASFIGVAGCHSPYRRQVERKKVIFHIDRRNLHEELF